MRPHRGARAARGVLVALFATFVALMSHVAGGGEMPGWLGLLAPLMLAAAVSTVLMGRQLSLLRLTLSVVASQSLFHMMFTLGGPDGSSLLRGHSHHAVTSIADVTATADHVHASGGMLAAHAVAAAITVAGIYLGERSVVLAASAVAGVQAWLQRVAMAITISLTQPPVAGRARAISHAVRTWRSLCVLDADPRRGPPLTFGI